MDNPTMATRTRQRQQQAMYPAKPYTSVHINEFATPYESIQAEESIVHPRPSGFWSQGAVNNQPQDRNNQQGNSRQIPAQVGGPIAYFDDNFKFSRGASVYAGGPGTQGELDLMEVSDFENPSRAPLG
jgi:hypothetical protein